MSFSPNAEHLIPAGELVMIKGLDCKIPFKSDDTLALLDHDITYTKVKVSLCTASVGRKNMFICCLDRHSNSVCARPFTVKEDCGSDGEDDVSADALVEEMLQQGDTAVIYPEAPEDEPQRQGTPDASIHDENGTGHHHTAITSRLCYSKNCRNAPWWFSW